MHKGGSAEKIILNSFDNLFGLNDAEADIRQVKDINIDELYEFEGHPFKIKDDEKMQELTDSIREYGVLVPGIARIRQAGGYEIVAGHSRCHACRLANVKTIPMIIKNLTDDEATIIMVDSNIQREDILPSEKAKAYKMKYDAIKHQGSKGNSSLELIGEAAGESGKTVQRYVWLARLNDELLDMVDNKHLTIVQGVDLSYLNSSEQEILFDVLTDTGCSMTSAQSAFLKDKSINKELDESMIRRILIGQKVNKKQRKIIFKAAKLDKYFDDKYSDEEIENIIIRLLDKWIVERGDD